LKPYSRAELEELKRQRDEFKQDFVELMPMSVIDRLFATIDALELEARCGKSVFEEARNA